MFAWSYLVLAVKGWSLGRESSRRGRMTGSVDVASAAWREDGGGTDVERRGSVLTRGKRSHHQSSCVV